MQKASKKHQSVGIKKHHGITARGIPAKQIAKTALECGFRDFDASRIMCRKPSVHQGLRAFYIGSKTASVVLYFLLTYSDTPQNQALILIYL